MIKVTSIEETIAQADGTVKKSTAFGIDPFDYITIASVCMGIFKSLFLKGEYKIEITRDEKSHWYAVNYLEGLEVVNFDDTNYRCDGFVVNPTGKGTIYEFYGKS